MPAVVVAGTLGEDESQAQLVGLVVFSVIPHGHSSWTHKAANKCLAPGVIVLKLTWLAHRFHGHGCSHAHIIHTCSGSASPSPLAKRASGQPGALGQPRAGEARGRHSGGGTNATSQSHFQPHLDKGSSGPCHSLIGPTESADSCRHQSEIYA